MARDFLGPLDQGDPVCSILAEQALPCLGVRSPSREFQVYRLVGSNAVFEYEHRASGTRVVGKFHGAADVHDQARAVARMWREHDAINRVRQIGFTGHPHHVARAVATAPHLGAALFLEYLAGEALGAAMEGVASGLLAPHVLYQRLASLAYFLATMHNRTAIDQRVDARDDTNHLRRLAEDLWRHGHLAEPVRLELGRLADRWERFEPMWQDGSVCLHGDATPANFLFREGIWVGAIDFERSRYGDRAVDVGRIAGEIQHHFMLHRGRRADAEPFVGHFLWEYACHFPDRERAFDHICMRIPLHLATTMLRIARNPWLSDAYRGELIAATVTILASR